MRADLEFGSIPALVTQAARRYGEREAVVEGRTRLTFAQLAKGVARAAAACLAHGVEPGDRVAVWAPNTADWVVAALGALSAGGVLVPLNTRFKGAEAAYVLRRTRARLLFVTGTFLGTSYVAALRRAAGGTNGSGGPGPVPTGPLPGLPYLRDVVVLADDAPADFRTWPQFLAAGDGVGDAAVRRRIGEIRPGDPSDIIFTSGTTGHPKGAVVSHAQTLRVYGVWSRLAGLTEGDRYLVVNPFFHTFGYKAGIVACLLRGATIVPQPVFDPAVVLANLAAEHITVLPGPPTVLTSLLDHPDRGAHDLSALRVVVTGAAVVPLELVERLRGELGVATVLTAYGLTEATGTVSMCRPTDPPEVVAATCGRPLPGTEVRIAADGEVLVRGYHVMSGYFEDPVATAGAVDPDGWLHTGDIGSLDEAGNLRITDRVKDMFIVGGFNAYPAEIERVLRRHPDVADAAVIGVPDPRLGEVGKAFVVRRPDTALTADALISWSRREMANFKVPRAVEFVAELPRNASGKVLKRALRG
ncbi:MULTISPECIES: FadD3 family acyl-CoA ligase [Streptomycetaceae]|uniref:Acyl-CoA synthetase n=1 Tax=Streptantibioticus cattleyicolor (strain ATCC 35852 / DSM 46488 / JCM 4925 / NBRC 14057 / NRRL 8057) TaxID=1003195 RepID=F8JZ40_STREN|nr:MULTISPECIES: FadD3 family acyl-CoA ligase [Streptomycetaceae]AEW94707.1 acyl-CoA synthetase [Streptantibioticus cattleyicolor NRRL 8057 = DSM 46488]MYS59338.1 AMP-binding protein [Streptomyces sp. SID5468]CCB75062.1 Acyl-CoA synthetase [Streptantibioticus cattleyicolor NRRL 8057 = DSM 46488]